MVMIPSFDTDRLTSGFEHANSFSSFFFSFGFSQSHSFCDFLVACFCLVGDAIPGIDVLLDDEPSCGRDAGKNPLASLVDSCEAGRGPLVESLLVDPDKSLSGF